MTDAKKTLVSIIASAAAACCFTSCGAKEPTLCGGTTDYTNKNAPKTIQSKNITSFSFYVETMGAFHSVPSKGGNHIGVRNFEGFPTFNACRFNLDSKGEQAEFKVSCSQTHGMQTFKAEGITDKSALIRLQEIIDEYNVAQLNGFYKRNSALGNSFSLKVKYDSEETITAGAEGGASVSPNTYLPRQEFSNIFSELVAKSGKKVPGSVPPADTMNRFNLKFTNFHPVESFPEGRYQIGYVEFGQRRQAYFEHSADNAEKTVFTEKITKEEASELKAFIAGSDLKNLSGYQLNQPEKGDHKFEWEMTYEDRTWLRAEAVGDESVQPAKYWDDNGQCYVSFFQKLMKKYGRQFPSK